MQQKTVEDYCRLVSKFDSGEGARSSDLCKALNLSKNTVALTLQKLAGEGFISMEKYGRARLKPKGSRVARRMDFKHRVIETFLHGKLGMDPADIHSEACAMEHGASDDMVRRLYDFMGRPKTDPHGRPISLS